MDYLDVLPKPISDVLRNRCVNEVRLRNGKPLRVLVDGRWQFVLNSGALAWQSGEDAFIVGDVDEVIEKACCNSIFAYEKMLADGYLTLSDGSRIGVAGEVSNTDSGVVFRKYTSVCIRVPHVVDINVGNIENASTLVLGAPCSGKTTFVRKCACELSRRHNVVVADERGEISLCKGFDEISNADVLLWCSKKYAFETAIRSLSPEYIVCDEVRESDFAWLNNCINSGVKVVASMHCDSAESLKNNLICSRFDNVVYLTRSNGIWSSRTIK